MNKFVSTIHLALRAQKISFGEQLLIHIRQQKVYVVIVASDAGIATSKKIYDKCKTYQIPIYTCLNKSEMQEIFHKNISAIGIKDKNLSIKFIENLRQEGSGPHEEKDQNS